VNVLFITLDQFRGDSLSCAGHAVARTPNLDALAAEGVRFAEHHGQAAPCAPGRASLYTGTYQMNHRVVTNGSPLDDRFDNVARLARRAGNTPVLFGYTDQALDPRLATGPGDPRLFTYEGVLSGFEVGLDLTGEMVEWQRWLTGLGHEVGGTIHEILGSEPTRPAEHSVSAFLTDRVIEWIGTHDEPWFLHASYLRPHPTRPQDSGPRPWTLARSISRSRRRRRGSTGSTRWRSVTPTPRHPPTRPRSERCAPSTTA
jgi:arylsulfatase A-like enzyme